MKSLKYILVSIFAITLVLNCGSDKKKEETKEIKLNSSPKTEEKVDENVANIVITGNDVMKFNTNEIKVKSGQKVRLTLRHIGKLDAKIMGHNLVVLKQDVNISDFAALAASANDNKYIPKDSEDIIAHTDIIGGGQTTTIEFDAPEAGTYTFLCSFPGHYAMMQGKFIVE
jgi:azurin